jgi:HxlR-like helix-turn-helix protein
METVVRKAYPQVPPKLEDSLTAWGQALCPALDAILKYPICAIGLLIRVVANSHNLHNNCHCPAACRPRGATEIVSCAKIHLPRLFPAF